MFHSGTILMLRSWRNLDIDQDSTGYKWTTRTEITRHISGPPRRGDPDIDKHGQLKYRLRGRHRAVSGEARSDDSLTQQCLRTPTDYSETASTFMMAAYRFVRIPTGESSNPGNTDWK